MRTNFQHLIPFRPFIHLVLILIRYKGMHWRRLPVLLPWLLKTLLFEPFRWLEALYVAIRLPFVHVQDPIFILGYYRSGTTWLQQLTSTDPAFATPTIFQTIFPECMLVLESILKPCLQWASKRFQLENKYHRLPFDWDFPGEEDVAINALAYLCDFNRIYQYPSQATHIIEKHFRDERTQQQWLRAHQYYVKKLSLKYGNKRLVLKSPPNTGRIRLLKSIYPTAQFIFIQRNPKMCLISTRRLWGLNRPFSLEEYSETLAQAVAEYAYTVFHEQYERDKAQLQARELAELRYETFIQNPLAQLDQVYQTLGLANDAVKRKAKQQLIEARAGYQPIAH
ncbi:MAG: sulfotransferase family protein [Flammeovirgaceae bacterium]